MCEWVLKKIITKQLTWQKYFFTGKSGKKTAFKDVSSDSTWNGILVSSDDSAQRFSCKKLLVSFYA